MLYDEAEKQEGEAEMKAGDFEVLASRNLDVHGNRRLQDRRLAMAPPKRRGRCSRITHVESVRLQRMMKRLLCIICHEVSRWVVLRYVPDLHCSVSAVESRSWNLGLGCPSALSGEH